MKFTILTDCEDEHELTSLGEIEWAVDRLGSEPQSFLCVVPESPVGGFTYMQAAHIQKTKGLFRKKVVASYYQLEVQERKPDESLYQYFLDTENKEDVLKAVCDFYESSRVPDLAGWSCELFYKAEG